LKLKHKLTFTNFPRYVASWLCCKGVTLQTVQTIIGIH